MARGRRQGLLIAGGGAAGCLAALAMVRLRPEVPLIIVEESEQFGGACFHHLFTDEVEGEAQSLLAAIPGQRWPGFYLAFPGLARNLKGSIGGFIPDALHRLMVETLRPEQYRLGAKVVAVRDDAIVLDGGEEIRAEGALDARGATNLSMLETLYETRVERQIITAHPHRLDRPLLIDATIEQNLGFSFIQAFPLGPDRLRIAKLLVSERSRPDEAAEARLDHYLAMRGWSEAEVVDRCAMARPLPIGGDFAAFWRIGGARVAKLGLRGGFFNPATGRTLADAARCAILLAAQKDFAGAALHDLFEEEARQAWKRREPQRAINAVIAASPPEARRMTVERLYRLDPGTILRFRSDRLGMLDRRRIQKALRGE
jgi:lycopene beta-cyclase